MKRFLKIAFMAVIGLGIMFFYGCEKDIENIDLKSQTSLKTKSMGNHQQPTQMIEINTTINIQNVEYPVAGNAEIGRYDLRMYECNAMWDVHLDEINEDIPLHLTALLRSEFEDLTTEVEPLMENYIIVVNGNHIEPNFVLIENGIEVTTYEAISEVWIKIIDEYDEKKQEVLENQIRIFLAEGLISFKESLEPYYFQSTSYEDFIDLLEVDEEGTSELGNNLLMLAYECLSNGYSDQYILDHYTGKHMAAVASYLVDNPSSDGSELFATTSDGGNSPCKWWQLGCHVNRFIDWYNSEPVRVFFKNLKEDIDIILGAAERIVNLFKS